MAVDPEILNKLEELLAAIKGFDDPRRASAEWKQAFNLLKKTDLNANTVANVIAMRGVDRLVELIEQLKEPAMEDLPPDPDGPDDETCRNALRAFKKRLKLTRLDDESQVVSRDPLSKGSGSGITSIIPPNEFEPKVWKELVRRGKLRYAREGFYELVDD